MIMSQPIQVDFGLIFRTWGQKHLRVQSSYGYPQGGLVSNFTWLGTITSLQKLYLLYLLLVLLQSNTQTYKFHLQSQPCSLNTCVLFPSYIEWHNLPLRLSWPNCVPSTVFIWCSLLVPLLLTAFIILPY